MTYESDTARRHSFIVGIAGGAASGKSTFAKALALTLDVGPTPLRTVVVNTDGYLRCHDPHGPRVAMQNGELLFDRNQPDSWDNARLAADLDRLSGAGGAPDVILVEGPMVLHVPSIRERLDLRLFIELDVDKRALRRLLHDVGPESPIDMAKARWVADYYCASAHVGHKRFVEPSRAYADLILRGDADFARTAAMVAAVVRSHLCPGGTSAG